MSLDELLGQLDALGVSLVLDGDDIRVQAPRGALTPALRSELKAQADAIRERLRRAPAGGGRATMGTAIPAAPRDRALPLSYAQQRLWFLGQLEPGSPFYNLPIELRIDGPLEVDALRRALEEIVRRHEVLRTTFPAVDGEPVQRVHPPGQDRPLPVIDLSTLAPPERGAEARRLAAEEARRPFDLAQGPLLRTTLLRLEGRRHALVMNMHHIVADGWSLGLLMRELVALYQAFIGGHAAALPALPVQYADYAAWQRQRFTGALLERQLDYWRRQLASVPELDFPTDRPRPPVQTFHGARVPVTLSRSLADRLYALASAEGVTTFMLLLAAYQVLLHRHTRQEDIVVGIPVSERTRTELEGAIGMFVNTLAVRTDLGGRPTFRELLGRVREVMLDAFAHQELPFDKLVEELSPARDTGRSPLFQAVLAMQSTPATEVRVGDTLFSPGVIESGVAKFDLTLQIEESAHGLTGHLEYNTDLFEATTAERVARRLQTLLEGIAADPDTRIGELPLLPPEELRLLETWSAPREEFPHTASLHELVAMQALRRPEAVAAICEDARLTYGALNARANRLAHHLRQLAGASGGELRIGVCLERSLDLVVTLLAILKAGGAYVPLDPTYPPERLALMLDDTGAPIVVTHAAVARTQPGLVDQLRRLAPQSRIVDLDADGAHVAAQPSTDPALASLPDMPAYVIYTSGSTGTPKGVAVSHRNVVRLFAATQAWFQFDERDVWSMFHSYAFDFSVWELWGALCHGGSVVVVPREVARSPEAFYELLCARQVTVLNQTPSAFHALMHVATGARATDALALRLVIFGGEKLDFQSLRPWLERHGDEHPRLVNMYGITETTVHVTYRPVTMADLADTRGSRPGSTAGSMIGGALPDLQLLVLDPDTLQQVPVGVPGELHVGGAGLAHGYLGRPALTAQRFIPNPFSARPGARLYRTGDLARYLPSGDLEYLGRIDRQVKVRGHRIELGEIEAALSRCPGVAQAAVSLREDRPGDAQLVAYLVGPTAEPELDAVRARLRTELPPYMVPGHFVPLAALPLTVQGKLDRAALPPPTEVSDAARAGAGEAAPRDERERAVAAVWGAVLGRDVGRRDRSFFELGGHSLLAIRACARLREQGWSADLRAVFEAPTLADFARRLERRDTSLDSVTEPGDVDGAAPLSHAQQRIWFQQQMRPGTVKYHIAGGVRLQGALDRAALARSVALVARRHHALRTVFALHGNQPVQRVRDDLPLGLDFVNLGDVPGDEREGRIGTLVRRQVQSPFDLKIGPLVRAFLVRSSDHDHRLFLIIHHLISDGWTLELLIREIGTAYAAYRRGQEPVLPAVRRQLPAFARAERSRLATEDALAGALAYWREQLGGRLPISNLPTDHPAPAEPGDQAGHVPFACELALVERLEALGHEHQATLFMTVLSAVQVLLHRYSGDVDILVVSPIAQRGEPGLESMVGLCINMLALRVSLEGDPGFDELLARTRRAALDAYEHQALPFDRVVEHLRPRRGAGGAAAFRVAFALEDTLDEAIVLPGLQVERIELHTGATEYDLTFNLRRSASGLVGSVTYRTELFERATIEGMCRHLGNLLAAIATAPSMRIGALPLLAASERHEMIHGCNDTAVAFDAPACLHEMVEAQAGRTPDAPALRQGACVLSYRELDQRANGVARRLRALGVAPGERVGICMERSPELVLATLGVLKAGAAFVPLDPDYPASRLRYMWQDSGARVLVTSPALTLPGVMEALAGAQQLVLDPARLPAPEPERVASGAAAETPAYIMYTSGSTGRPKGVVIPHRGIRNRVAWAQHAYRLSASARVLHKAPFGFDAAIWEIFWPLSMGATLVIALPGIHRDPEALADFMAREQVEVAHFVPSLLERALASDALARCRSLTHVFSGGEVLTTATAERLLDLVDVRLFNQYGPTETSCNVTFAEYRRSDHVQRRTVSIGRPIANTQIYVIDDHGEPVPYGVAGEIHVGGANVGLGYQNMPGETAARFLPDPFAGGGVRMYRTGDLGRWRRDRTIEYLGRRDRQVKLRGVRIELQEIEAVLLEHPAVSDAVAVVHGDGAGDAQIVAYVVADDSERRAIRAHLHAMLPPAMVPGALITLAALPLGPSGKVDVRSLPPPDADARSAGDGDGDGFVPPKDEVEQRLAELWQEVLQVDRVGRNDNFFELGGHSLLATTLIARMHDAFAVDIELRGIFAAPTLAEMAALIHGQRSSVPADEPALRRDQRAALLDRLDELSDEELDALIAEGEQP